MVSIAFVSRLLNAIRQHARMGVLDASWNRFRTYVTYKAASAGRKVVMVNPAYTSQMCSGCGS
ncbi:MAG: zinc ribbon domain-containing protein, partial [Methanothrix sp.]|nr:zinc ribbon domain-containing protein [Methanothrix sp.]